ncbi:hypothetical protein J6590_029972 [Homalodisca vitripennis]|nr:hypothetical protein J6590_029972 [Homalodisca vitripennis]
MQVLMGDGLQEERGSSTCPADVYPMIEAVQLQPFCRPVTHTRCASSGQHTPNKINVPLQWIKTELISARRLSRNSYSRSNCGFF